MAGTKSTWKKGLYDPLPAEPFLKLIAEGKFIQRGQGAPEPKKGS